MPPNTGVPCSNAAKTRNPSKFAGVPQTTGPISAASGQKFTILWEHMEEILLLNRFFPIVDMCLSCEDIARQSCAMVPRWRFFNNFLRPVFATSPVQHVSDLHFKFALRLHHVCKYGRHPICDGWDQARNERKKEERTNDRMNIWPALLHRAVIKKANHFPLHSVSENKLSDYTRRVRCRLTVYYRRVFITRDLHDVFEYIIPDLLSHQ